MLEPTAVRVVQVVPANRWLVEVRIHKTGPWCLVHSDGDGDAAWGVANAWARAFRRADVFAGDGLAARWQHGELVKS